MTTRPAKLVLTSIVLGTLFVAASPARAIVLPVTVVGDTWNIPNWASQLAHQVTQITHQVTQINNQVAQIQNQANQIRLATAELKQLPMSWKNGQNVSSFESATLGANPETQAATVAYNITHGLNGTISSSDIQRIEGEYTAAYGSAQQRQAAGDASMATIAELRQIAELDAARALQDAQNVASARNQRDQMMDVLGNPTDNFDY